MLAGDGAADRDTQSAVADAVTAARSFGTMP